MPTNYDNTDTFAVPDYKVQEKIRAERRKQANDLLAKAHADTPDGEMVSGIYVPKNDNWSKFAQAAVGGYQNAGIDAEALQEAKDLADIRNQLLNRLPSETRTETTPGLVRPAGNNPDEEGSYQAPPTTRQILNDQFDTEARKWAIQAGQVPGLEPMASSMFSESVKAPGRRMEKQEQREARAAELEAARIARQQEAQANREWREAEANRNRDDKEAARQLNAEDRAAQAREARADRAANAAAIRAEKAAAPKPLTPKQKETQRGFTDLEKSLNNYESMLADYDPQSAQAVSPTQRAALESAFTDLQMKIKTLYELGAPQAGDLKLLEQSLANPTSLKGTLAGAAFGKEPILAKTGQIRTLLDNSRDSFDQQLGVESPRAPRTAPPQQSVSGSIAVQVNNAADYAKLKSGTKYIDPQGNRRTKP